MSKTNMYGLHTKKPKQDFFVKKRGLFTKAIQVAKDHNSDVYVVIHKKDSNDIISTSTSRDFTLEKILSLILDETKRKQNSYLKNKNNSDPFDFDNANRLLG